MKSSRRITPWLLREHGIAVEYPELKEVGGAWKNTYQVYNLSMEEIGGNLNRRIGCVSIDCRPAGGGYVVETVRKTLMEQGNIFAGNATLRISEECRADEYATPIRWRVNSAYSSFDEGRTQLVERADTRFSEEGEFCGSVLRRRAIPGEGRWHEMQLAGPLCSNWGIFVVLQRKTVADMDGFSLLEDALRFKPGYALRAVPDSTAEFDKRIGTLSSMVMWGRGNLPYEFWRDGNGRVVTVVNGSKVLVLDDRAEEIIAHHEAEGKVYPAVNLAEE